MTPEGKVKAAVTRVLQSFSGLYYFMPVPYGYGESSLDYIICFRGVFIAVETKVPGKKMTPRQEMTANRIASAGGVVFEIASGEDVLRFAAWMLELSKRPEVSNVVARTDGKREAPNARVSRARRRPQSVPGSEDV